MQAYYPQMMAAVVFFGLIGGANCTSPRINGGDKAISKTIDVRDLRRQVAGAQNSHFILDVYPIKKTAEPDRKDFDLAVFVRSDDKIENSLDGGYNDAEFRRQAANYVRYLYQKKVTAKDIPQLYIVEMDKERIESKSRLTITIPQTPSLGSYRMAVLAGMSGGTGSTGKVQADSVPVCQCPPGPCTGCPKGYQASNAFLIDTLIRKQYITGIGGKL